jgi:hypothetical protein
MASAIEQAAKAIRSRLTELIGEQQQLQKALAALERLLGSERGGTAAVPARRAAPRRRPARRTSASARAPSAAARRRHGPRRADQFVALVAGDQDRGRDGEVDPDHPPYGALRRPTHRQFLRRVRHDRLEVAGVGRGAGCRPRRARTSLGRRRDWSADDRSDAELAELRGAVAAQRGRVAELERDASQALERERQLRVALQQLAAAGRRQRRQLTAELRARGLL